MAKAYRSKMAASEVFNYECTDQITNTSGDSILAKPRNSLAFLKNAFFKSVPLSGSSWSASEGDLVAVFPRFVNENTFSVQFHLIISSYDKFCELLLFVRDSAIYVKKGKSGFFRSADPCDLYEDSGYTSYDNRYHLAGVIVSSKEGC